MLDGNTTLAGHDNGLGSSGYSQADGVADLADSVNQGAAQGLVLLQQRFEHKQGQRGPGGINTKNGQYHS
ncbi:hypothetical protein ColLi_12472 [Colletotrichum liriopes]|uniref:Uncharacterized protein n=1 Tax=Colletotrichum liriopes TaxID=708192 RepID=A0AA37LYS3_9PEZI|nr:hypothetical protein ColLi_12472 [Colletotrichum liriopes]